MSQKGKLNRYNYWKTYIKALSEKYGITEFQTVSILDNVNEFKDMYNIAENSEFIMYFLNGTLPNE
jgi:hypothetical protein